MERKTPKRLGITVTVAFGAIVAFAAIGGTGLAGSLAKPVKAQYAPGQFVNLGKVILCHKQKVTIRVSTRAVPAHAAHGDTVGSCAAARAAQAKAAKAKAAQAKAAAKAEKAAAKAGAKVGQSAPTQGGGRTTTPAPKANNGQGKAKGKGK